MAKTCVREVADYLDKLVFVKVRETGLAHSLGAQISGMPKIGVENLVTLYFYIQERSAPRNLAVVSTQHLAVMRHSLP